MTAMQHPVSSEPYQQVPRCEDPVCRVYDLAMLTFAGPDGELAKGFYQAFGLTLVEENSERLVFAAEAGAPAAVIYEHQPKAAFLGPVFAVRRAEELLPLAAHAGGGSPTALSLPGNPEGVRLRDPNGLLVQVAHFPDWRPLPATETPAAGNVGSAKNRINATVRPARRPTRVLRLGHMVLGTPKWEATASFYINTLGLIPSDVQAMEDGRPAVAFMRCDRGDEPADHHTFVVARLPLVDFEHAAFETLSLDEVAMGGEVLAAAGFKRAWGIGRHILGSQIFDYWFGPDHRKFEHFADGDVFDSAYPTHYHPMNPESLAQWGPPVSAAFLRPRMSLGDAWRVLVGLFSGGDFGWREARQMLRALKPSPQTATNTTDQES